jgi:N-acetylglucosaminyl-diphospho-decaprenol L-rhamnosyltransferase
MNYKLNELTVIIVTFKTDKTILKNCLSSIDPNVKVIIVENSESFKYKNEIENNFKNVKVLCSGSNIGMGAGNNYGLSNTKTNYALILNPDIICNKNFFLNIQKYLEEKIDFTIIGGVYESAVYYKTAGFFDGKNLTEANFIKEFNLYEVDWVLGHTMLINRKKFDQVKIFDENFFLFYEETDLCKSVKIRNENIFMSSDLVIEHLGFKGSFASNKKFELEAIKIRNWHYMWSFFYYHKKTYGYLNAIKKSFGKLIRSIFKTIFYFLIFKKKERTIYFFRFLGLFNSIMNRKSFFRVDLKD